MSSVRTNSEDLVRLWICNDPRVQLLAVVIIILGKGGQFIYVYFQEVESLLFLAP